MTTSSYSQYLLALDAEQRTPGLTQILGAIAEISKEVSAALGQGSMIVDSTQTDTPSSADGMVDEVTRTLLDSLQTETANIRTLAAITVEGDPGLIPGNPDGQYLLLMGGLQGMANLYDNLMVGSTFSVLERQNPDGPATVDEFLQPGSRQVCAGIVLFGVRTILLLTTGDGVDGFTLDRNLGSFVLTNPKMAFPEGHNRYSIDATQAPRWPSPVKRYIDECIQGKEGPRGEDFQMRWNPSELVGVFRVINSGGLFLGPDVGDDSRLLSLLHSAAPLALLVEQVGGAASNGTGRILEIQPEKPDQRTEYYFGSASEVDRIEKYFADFHAGLDEEPSYRLFRDRSLFTA